jgi:hypothetical protein
VEVFTADSVEGVFQGASFSVFQGGVLLELIFKGEEGDIPFLDRLEGEVGGLVVSI